MAWRELFHAEVGVPAGVEGGGQERVEFDGQRQRLDGFGEVFFLDQFASLLLVFGGGDHGLGGRGASGAGGWMAAGFGAAGGGSGRRRGGWGGRRIGWGSRGGTGSLTLPVSGASSLARAC